MMATSSGCRGIVSLLSELPASGRRGFPSRRRRNRRLIRLASLPPSLERIGAAEPRPAFPAESLHVEPDVLRAHRITQHIARLLLIGMRGRISLLQPGKQF